MDKRKDTVKFLFIIVCIFFIISFIYINIPQIYMKFLVWLGNEEVVSIECSTTDQGYRYYSCYTRRFERK